MTEDDCSELELSGHRGGGFLVAEELPDTHPSYLNYYLLAGDLLRQNEDGSFSKLSPGLRIEGFELTEAQRNRLQPVSYRSSGANYYISEEEN